MGVGEYFEKTDEEYLRELVDESELGLERGITLDRLRVEKDICYDETDIKFYGGVFPIETAGQISIAKRLCRVSIGVKSSILILDMFQRSLSPTKRGPGVRSRKNILLL